MKFVYPAIFHPEKDGTWTGVLPDLNSLSVTGKTLEDAVDSANDAARDWLEIDVQEGNFDFPQVTDIHDLKIEPGDIVRNIACIVRFYVGWDE